MKDRYAEAELKNVDPRDPFSNPTEEPDYSPDYRSILPELPETGGTLPLIPSPFEASRIRSTVDITCLTLLFAFFMSSTIRTLGGLLIHFVMRQNDLARLSELPQSYDLILSQVMENSSIQISLALIAFLLANLTALAVGCRLSGLRGGDFFHRTRRAGFARILRYVLLGLFVQRVTAILVEQLGTLLGRLNLPFSDAGFQPGTSPLRNGVFLCCFCLVKPVTEELLLRGFALKNLSRVSQRFGILMSAFLFAVMQADFKQALCMFPLGILLGYITVRHNTLFPAMTVHIAANAQTAFFLYAEEFPEILQNAARGMTLLILAAGAVLWVIQLLRERLPDNTPHQSLRGMRIAVTAPLFWVYLLVMVCAALWKI